jgi:hypothetical protein
VLGHVVDARQHAGVGVAGGGAQAAQLDRAEVVDVVADERDLVRGEPVPVREVAERRGLVLDPLEDV